MFLCYYYEILLSFDDDNIEYNFRDRNSFEFQFIPLKSIIEDLKQNSEDLDISETEPSYELLFKSDLHVIINVQRE